MTNVHFIPFALELTIIIMNNVNVLKNIFSTLSLEWFYIYFKLKLNLNIFIFKFNYQSARFKFSILIRRS